MCIALAFQVCFSGSIHELHAYMLHYYMSQVIAKSLVSSNLSWRLLAYLFILYAPVKWVYCFFRVITISACAQSHPASIALRYVQRRVLMSDPNWNKGFYYDGPYPRLGMKHARSVVLIPYYCGNGLETWQSSLLCVFVCYFRGWPCTNHTKGGYVCHRRSQGGSWGARDLPL